MTNDIRIDMTDAMPAASRRIRTPAAARYVGLSPSTLEKDRLTGALGIPFLKLGKIVVYDTEQLDEWLAAHRRRSTSDTGIEATRAENGEAGSDDGRRR